MILYWGSGIKLLPTGICQLSLLSQLEGNKHHKRHQAAKGSFGLRRHTYCLLISWSVWQSIRRYVDQICNTCNFSNDLTTWEIVSSCEGVCGGWRSCCCCRCLWCWFWCWCWRLMRICGSVCCGPDGVWRKKLYLPGRRDLPLRYRPFPSPL